MYYDINILGMKFITTTHLATLKDSRMPLNGRVIFLTYWNIVSGLNLPKFKGNIFY